MHINSTTNSSIFGKNRNSKNKESNLNGNFEKELNKNSNNKQNETIEIKRSYDELVEDIFSIIKTGFTKAELEEIEKLKELILEKIKAEDKNPSNKGIEKIKDLLDKLNQMIQQIKKRAMGVVIKNEQSKDSSTKTESSTDEIINLKALKDTLDNLDKQIKELKGIEIQTKQTAATKQEELYLIKQLQNA